MTPKFPQKIRSGSSELSTSSFIRSEEKPQDARSEGTRALHAHTFSAAIRSTLLQFVEQQ